LNDLNVFTDDFLQILPGYSVEELISVGGNFSDYLIRHPAVMFDKPFIKNDIFLMAEEIEDPDLFSGQLYPELMDTVVQEIRIGP
jgi:hypothetical protein